MGREPDETSVTASTVISTIDRSGTQNRFDVYVYQGKFTDSWPQEIFDAVGQLAIAFSQLERVLWLSIKRIRGLAILDFRLLNAPEFVDKMVKQLEKDIAILPNSNAVKQLLAGVLAANKRRNDFVHGAWIMKPDGESALIRREVFLEVDIGDVRALVDLVRYLRNELNRIDWPELTEDQRARLKKFQPRARM